MWYGKLVTASVGIGMGMGMGMGMGDYNTQESGHDN
jgi:hypothetical protein